MAAGKGVQRPWSELPGDLLATIYRGCSSAHDRARFAAVCTSWCTVASWHPPLPALPLLLMLPSPCAGDLEVARAYSPEDSRAVRVPLPSVVSPGTRLVGSHDGGWIAATCSSGDHGQQLLIMNPFSGIKVALSLKQSIDECVWPHEFDASFSPIKKVVFSGDPSSSDCMLAAITARCNLALCRVRCTEATRWTTHGCDAHAYGELVDIAFFNGELYGLSHNNKLLTYEVVVNQDGGAPTIAKVHTMSDIGASIQHEQPSWCEAKHIFELRGKVAVAVEFCEWRDLHSYFRVYELAGRDERTPYQHKWVQVRSLGEQALLLSPACSKAVHVGCQRGGVDRDYIYYPKRHSVHFEGERCMKRLDLGSCAVYLLDNGHNMHRMGRIMSRVYHYRHEDNNNGCMWFLPPDF